MNVFNIVIGIVYTTLAVGYIMYSHSPPIQQCLNHPNTDYDFLCNTSDECPRCEDKNYFYISECMNGICRLCSKIMHYPS